MNKTAFRALSGVAAAAGFVLALSLLSGPALANQCHYSDGNHDNGPCVEVRNELIRLNHFGDHEMNLWCHSGPTSRSHKIILRANDQSFTCRGIPGEGTGITIQRTQVGCNTCDGHFDCEGKVVLILGDTSFGQQLGRTACTIIQ